MRTPLSVAYFAAMTLLGCADANPNAQGGQPLLATPSSSSSSSGGSSGSTVVADGTFSGLYTSIFAPTLPSGCAMSAACHKDGGAGSSFWVCGDGASACRQGMLDGTPPLVPATGAMDATTTGLYMALHRPDCSPVGLTCNMPLGGAPLSADDIAAVTKWIQMGAPDN